MQLLDIDEVCVSLCASLFRELSVGALVWHPWLHSAEAGQMVRTTVTLGNLQM